MAETNRQITGAVIQTRLSAIQTGMQENGFAAVVLPTGDSHISEYPPEYWCTREWASGFTGSAGTLVVTHDKALLWTDGRYYIQAAQQLDGTTIVLQRGADPGCPKIEKWLCDNLDNGDKVGYDGRQLSATRAKDMRAVLQKQEIDLSLNVDPVAGIWKDRPPLPAAEVFVHEAPFCGQSVSEKLKLVRTEMQKKNATHYLVSSLDAVAWLLNIRGGDIPWTPLVLAYVLVGQDDIICFIDEAKCPATVKAHFSDNGIVMQPYDAVRGALEKFIAEAILLIDPKLTCAWLRDAVPDICTVEEMNDPIQAIKAVKHETELVNLRKCIDRDCIKVERVLDWIDNSIADETEITELFVSEQLENFRGEDNRYIGPSFQTIAAYGAHAALMHYAATEESDAIVCNAGFLLIDTGGQYFDGTTDITRTVACGILSEQQRRDYTLVLKAHIALCRAVFLEGTCGPHLDILARGVLAREGLNYRCGTGHSVGYCLNVHEGPHGISNGTGMVPLKPGMIVTNEPGIYREGEYGIRIENTLLVCEHNETEFGKFYAFEVLSHCPIDMRPVMQVLLTGDEREWIKEYHSKCDEVKSRIG